MQDDTLLTQYAHDGSEAAFSQLLARHMTLVYRTCLRETSSPTQAEDAAQVVFLLLARKAKSLHAGPSLAGWLYQTSRFVAKDVRKQEARRKLREQTIMQEVLQEQTSPTPEWDSIEPLLNDALSALRPADREAVLLRFFEGNTLAETGTLLGLTEDAARMRVARAVEKLRHYLTAHGAAVTSLILTGLLASETTHSVPAHAAAIITKGTLQAIATGPTTNVLLLSKGVSHTMKILKVKYVAVGVNALLVVGAVPFVGHAVPTRSSAKAPASKNEIASANKSGNALKLVGTDILPPAVAASLMSAPFTLTYKVVEKDISTTAMREAGAHWQRLQIAEDVKDGGSTQSEADEALRDLPQKIAHPEPSRSFFVTISARDGQLFYQRTEPGDICTVIYDGSQTSTYDAEDKRLTYNPGLYFCDMYDFPVPGVSLPSLPLLQSPSLSNKVASHPASSADGNTLAGDTLDINVRSLSGSASYRSGELATIGQGSDRRVQSMTVLWQGFPLSQWRFMKYRQFKGLWIASAMQYYTFYGTDHFVPAGTPPSAPWRPMRLVDFQLQQASEDALNASQFIATANLKQNDQVQRNNTRGEEAILYDPRKGSLDEQFADHAAGKNK